MDGRQDPEPPAFGSPRPPGVVRTGAIHAQPGSPPQYDPQSRPLQEGKAKLWVWGSLGRSLSDVLLALAQEAGK
jgi:hypothetical protein